MALISFNNVMEPLLPARSWEYREKILTSLQEPCALKAHSPSCPGLPLFPRLDGRAPRAPTP